MRLLIFKLVIFCLLLSSCIDDLALQNDMPISENSNEAELSSDVVFSDVVKTQNGLKIQDALVTIFASNQKFAVYTDENGAYRLAVPSELLPSQGIVSLNIIHAKYKPVTVSYIAPLDSVSILNSNGVSSKIELCPNCLDFKTTNFSELYHLGDDDYDGPENSQLQKATDGLEILFEFQNSENYTKLKISFDAKGLQSELFDIPSSIDFGSSDSKILLERSPSDGSFEHYSFQIDNDQLHDHLVLRTTNVGRPDLNYDDWEFSSLFIEGIE